MSSHGELFKPGRIGKMELRNRLVMPPMSTSYADNGWVSQRLKDYYAERARGGAGLIIVESNCVEAPRGWRADSRLRIDDDKFIPSLRELTEAIHRHGAMAAQQLSHGGRTTKSSFTGCQPVAPSPVAAPGYEVPRELTVAEIREIIGCFARSAERAKRANFDAVEIHAAHGPLAMQFLSPFSNQRQDAYGGSLRNRARFLLEVIAAVREAVGADFPFWCRINGEDGDYIGSTPTREVQQLARLIDKSGVDAISVSGIPYCRTAFAPPAYFARTAAAVKRVVRIPVIVTGGITPEAAEDILRQKEADFIGVGRALIADPQFTNKVAEGRLEDINPCIRCLECLNILQYEKPIPCSVNASAGNEREFQVTAAAKKKRVLVIGGGPAGMEAARVAALRGHKVTLWEKGDRLGGSLIPAAAPDFKPDFRSLTDYLSTQIKKAGVNIELGKEASATLITRAKPDVVFIATGGSPIIPPVPGVAKKHVTTAIDALLGKSRVGKAVVVIGGGLVGGETALYLAQQGKTVTIIEILGAVMRDMFPANRQPLLERLADAGVKILTDSRVLEIKNKGVIIADKDGKSVELKADTVVLAAGMKANDGLFEAVKGKVPEAYRIGDCVVPRRLPAAISEGFRTARLV